MVIEGGAPNTDFQYAMNFAVFCKNFAPTKANRKYLSPAALYEGNDELKPSSRILKAVLFCLVHVYLYKEERRKHETRSYEAMFMGVDPSPGSFLVKDLLGGGLFHASDLAVHPNTFPYRGQSLRQDVRHHHERLEGARITEFNSLKKGDEVIQPGEVRAENLVPGESSEKLPISDLQLAASRPGRVREPSVKALEAIATYNIEEQISPEDETDPTSFEEAMASYDKDLWIKGIQKELDNFKRHGTLQAVKAEKWMRIFKAKLVFKRKRSGERKVRCVVQAFKRMFQKGIDFEESYAGTARWNTIILVLVLAVFYDYDTYLIDITAFFLNGLLAAEERIFMEAIPGQRLPPGFVNYVLGSIYGHPVSAYRAKQRLHRSLTRGGLFKVSKYDSCLYILVHKTEKFWVPVHVDDMPCAGTRGGLIITLARLREDFDITVEENPPIILGVQVEHDRKKRTAKLHQGVYIRKLLKKHGMENCNPRDTPAESNFTKQVKAQVASNLERKPLGMEAQYQAGIGELMWLLKSRPDLHFFVCFAARFMQCAGEAQMAWLKRALRYLAHFPEKGIMLIPGPKLYLHGGSDADWGGDDASMKSTSGEYLSLGDVGLVLCSSKLQRKVADSSTAAETYALHSLVRGVIEVYGKLEEMGEKMEKPVLLKQDNNAVIKMSMVLTAHSGSKHFRIPQAFIHDEVLAGLIKLLNVSSEHNSADCLTKFNASPKFKKDTRELMGPQP